MSKAPQAASQTPTLPNSGSELAGVAGCHECTYSSPQSQQESEDDIAYNSSNPLSIQLMTNANQQRTTISTYPAITHIAVLSLLLGSITFAPYLLIRRKIATLNREISRLDSANVRLQEDLRTAILASSERKAEQLRIRGLAFETHTEAKALRADFDRKERAQNLAHSALRGDFKKLEDGQARIASGVSQMRHIGTSIADIAQYIHELDLEQGSGRHTPLVDRLRSTALELQRSTKISPETKSSND